MRNALDGNKNTYFALQGGKQDGWWKADFNEKGVMVTQVKVTARGDCC